MKQYLYTEYTTSRYTIALYSNTSINTVNINQEESI